MSSRSGSIARETAGIAVAALEVLLAAVGLWMLGDVYVTAVRADFVRMTARVEIARAPAHPRSAAAGPAPSIVLPDAVLGELSIPRLRVSTAALEGDSAANLRLGIAHLPETPLPWQGGNSAFAGHRDTFFRALQSLREGDRIRLATSRGTFEYTVRHLLVVQPDEVWVLGPGLASLTLITCYPFTYAGSAPQRFIVQADRTGTLQTALTPAR